MNVQLIVRSPGTGHSLETLFDGILRELHRAGQIRPSTFVLPFVSHGPKTVWKNLASIRAAKPERVHITGDVHYAALVTPAAKTLLTIHDCVLLSRERRWSLRYGIFWLFWFYWPIRRAGLVTVVSEKTRRELRRYVGRLADKAVVVPCHYDSAFTHNPQPFNTDRPTVLHIGTAPHKNLSRLIEAIDGLPCRLLIVGKLTGVEVTELAERRINYRQYEDLSRDAIIALYGQCDLVAFVSLYEGFGMPILEAQAVGRPVITSNRPPMTDVGGAGACYVDPTDVMAIRRAIRQVWQDKEYREQLIRAGRANADRFTVQRVTAQYTALYQTLR